MLSAVTSQTAMSYLLPGLGLCLHSCSLVFSFFRNLNCLSVAFFMLQVFFRCLIPLSYVIFRNEASNQIPGPSCLPANQALLQGKLTKERSKLEAES